MSEGRNKSVLQHWVTGLSFKEQTGLISAVRGADYVNDEPFDSKKAIVKMLRYLILNNADDKTEFMSNKVLDAEDVIGYLMAEHDNVSNKNNLMTINPDLEVLNSVNTHWFDHIMLAVSIISKRHTNTYVRHYWEKVYTELNQYTDSECKVGVDIITVIEPLITKGSELQDNDKNKL